MICEAYTRLGDVRAVVEGQRAGARILVTDAMSAAGMPDGEYQLGGFAVHVADGRATATECSRQRADLDARWPILFDFAGGRWSSAAAADVNPRR